MLKLDDTWKYLYKVDYYDQTNCNTNLLYTPYVNSDGSILCIDYSLNPDYQKDNTVTQPLVSHFFEKELSYLKQFQGKSWVPNLLQVDGTKMFIEFTGETLNHILFSNRQLDTVLPDWREQLTEIMLDIDASGFYKLALYPHSFFIGKDGRIKVLDFYTFLEKDNPYIPRKFIEDMIGHMSRHRFDEATVGELIDFSKFFKQSLTTHLDFYWKDNPFPKIYDAISRSSTKTGMCKTV